MNKLLASVIYGNQPAVTFADIEFERVTIALYRQEDAGSIRLWTPANPYQYKALDKASNTVKTFDIQ
jgi:hypothetical protein